MKIRNLIILIAAFSLLILGGGLLAKQAQADDFGFGRNGVVERLTERFNLNEDEVSEELNQYREEYRAERQANREERWQQAVEDGVITEEQRQALIDKHNEIGEQHQRMREEMQTWMEENGIDFDALHEYGCGAGMGGRGGFGRGFVKGA